MFLFNNRDRKIHHTAICINTLIFTIVGFWLFIPNTSFATIVGFLFFLFILQYAFFYTPVLIEKLFFKPRNSEERTEDLQRKIRMLQEEIKMVNGQDYDEDVIYNDK